MIQDYFPPKKGRPFKINDYYKILIFISKKEIGVMRLVGASKMHVRGPFMIEGVIYGFISTLITLILFWPAMAWFGAKMTDFLGINMYDYYISNFFQIFIIILIIINYLYQIIQNLTVKHLKVIEIL